MTNTPIPDNLVDAWLPKSISGAELRCLVVMLRLWKDRDDPAQGVTITYKEIGRLAGVSNPIPPMQQLVRFGFVSKSEKRWNNGNNWGILPSVWQVHVDVIEKARPKRRNKR